MKYSRRLLLIGVALGSLAFVPPHKGEAMTPAVPTAASFEHSKTCAMCHDNSPRANAMRDAKGRGVAPYDLWQSSMMANSARDPLWRAVLSAEIAKTPSRKAAIEAKCMHCHTPMASPRLQGDTDYRLTTTILDDPTDPHHELAMDGVSCTVCHQIEPDNLGKPESYTGGFKIGPYKKAYGPHTQPFARPMQMHSGFTPTASNHVMQSSLCGSCHTVITHSLDAKGQPTGSSLPEQTPYFEWRNSIFTTEVAKPGPAAASCQDCHAPQTDVDGVKINTAIAHNPGGRDWPFLNGRMPFGRHIFVGGNALLPEIFRDNAVALGVVAPRAAFDATIALVKDQLRNRTAKLSVLGIGRNGVELRFTVKVENLAGHKFPSAYPSRRAFLHLRVRDRHGKVVLESGEYDSTGRLLDAAGKPLAQESAGAGLLVHRDVITASGQAQVWEAVMGDDQNNITFTLMRGAKYLKDNRLLPKGWSSTGPDAAATRPVGVGGDANYVAGYDEVKFQATAPQTSGPYTIEVDLLYQTLGARFADELFQVQTKEVKAFRGYWQKATRTPVLVDRVSVGAN